MPSWGPTSSKRHLLRSRPWQSARLRQHGFAKKRLSLGHAARSRWNPQAGPR